jgi:hypothetical protein
MALDPSIPLQYRPPQFANPLDLATKGGQLALLAQQMQAGQLAQQQKEQEMAQLAQYRQGLADLGPAPSDESMLALATRSGLIKPSDILARLTAKQTAAEQTAARRDIAAQASADRRDAAVANIDLRRDMLLQNTTNAEERNRIAAEANRLRDEASRRHDQTLRMIAAGNQAVRREIGAQGNKPPAGYRWTPTGDLEMIPGGPADVKAQGKEQGRGQITSIVDQLAAHYDALDKMKATIKPSQSAVKNVWGKWPLDLWARKHKPSAIKFPALNLC